MLQFESESVARLDILTEVCSYNANLSEVCTLCNNFIKWIDFIFRELEFLCLKDAQRNFHAIFSHIVEPLLQKVPPTLLLPVIPPPQPGQLALATSTLQVKSGYRVKEILVYEEIILKNLEELKAENSAIRERLNKQDEMFKTQAGTNTKTK